MTLWSEPVLGDFESTSTYDGEMGSTEPSKFGQSAYNSVRRFVIIRAREGHCLCV